MVGDRVWKARFTAGVANDSQVPFIGGISSAAITQADFNPATLNDPDVAEDWTGAVVAEVPLVNADAWLGRSAAGDATAAARTMVAWQRLSTRADVVRAFFGATLASEKVATLEEGTAEWYRVQSQIANGYAHFGPHSSPQMDMFIGYGSYEIPGFTYTGRYDQDPTTHFSGTENACVNCHMAPAEGETHTPHFFYAGGPEWNGCTDCHSASSAEGLYNSLRTQVEGKLDQIAVLLGFTDRDDFAANFDSQAAGVTVVQREAAYAAVFVMDDGSHGVHNPAYAVGLLDNAIAYLSPARVAGTR